MNAILASVPSQSPLVYLDDIVVLSKLPQNHIEQVRSILRLLYKALAFLNLMKCRFVAKTIDYLGSLMRAGHVELVQHNTDAAAKIKHPTTQKELR